MCMHNPCKAGCPSLKLQPSDVALDGLSTPCMASCPYLDKPTSHIHDMQQTKDIREPQPEPTPTALNLNNGFVLGPKLLNIHSEGPRPKPFTHSPKHPTPSCHSHHEQSCSFPSRARSGDGEPRTNLKWPVIRTFSRRDGELCPDTGPPPNSTSVEPSDANSKFANTAQTTTSTPSLSHAPNLCMSAPVSAPLPSPRKASQSPINQVEKH